MLYKLTANITDIYQWIESTVPKLVLEVLNHYPQGRIQLQHQSLQYNDGLRCYQEDRLDNLIHWSLPAEEVLRLIRASSRPFSGAYTTLEGQRKLHIFKANVVEHAGPFLAMPGQIFIKKS